MLEIPAFFHIDAAGFARAFPAKILEAGKKNSLSMS